MDLTFEQKREAAGQRLGIDPAAIPRNIAIIMDGNGRWATQQGRPRFEGHQQGAEGVRHVVQYCVDNGVEYLTLYSFSMQNWKRPQEEVDFLMYLYVAYLKSIQPKLMSDNVKLQHLGRRDPLPQEVLDAIDETVELTSKNTGLTLGLALNYASRAEIEDAVRAIAVKCKQGELDVAKIDEQCVSDHMYTGGWPELDLVIRSSGEMRISNFLLWQISYSEFYVTPTLWPDFNDEVMDKAMLSYANRARRFGDVTTKK